VTTTNSHAMVPVQPFFALQPAVRFGWIIRIPDAGGDPHQKGPRSHAIRGILRGDHLLGPRRPQNLGYWSVRMGMALRPWKGRRPLIRGSQRRPTVCWRMGPSGVCSLLHPRRGVRVRKRACFQKGQPMKKYTYRSEYIKCGKKDCKSCPHGPYWYRYYREAKKLHKQYVGKCLPGNDTRTPDLPHTCRIVITLSDALDVFGLKALCNGREMRDRFNMLARLHHPHESGSNQRIKDVNLAWEIIQRFIGVKH